MPAESIAPITMDAICLGLIMRFPLVLDLWARQAMDATG
jgi:hypothetical protein